MRITQLHLSGRSAWPPLSIDRLQPQLNVFYGKPGAGKSTIAHLVNHLLYGKEPYDKDRGQENAPSVPLTEGHVSIESPHGGLVLRRHLESDRTSRLTVAALNGTAVDSRTVRSLLADLSPRLVSMLFAVDFAEAPSIDWLLTPEFTRELAKARDRRFSGNHQGECRSAELIGEAHIDRRRVEELILQRDRISQAIEKQLYVRRQENGVLEQELEQVERDLEESRAQIDRLQGKLQGLKLEIAECALRLRYYSLEKIATSASRGPHQKQWHHEQRQVELADLEQEISRCRATLGELQLRESKVRGELAQVASDGTANRGSCLADSRTTLSVLERLVDDLDAEVARLARAHQPGQCTAQDAHAKLSPVAAMLRQQIYSLCGLVTEQERLTRSQQLSAESRQLARAQADMGERLEHLLARRETLLAERAASDRTAVLRPQAPATDHCLCEQHATFITQADGLLVGYVPRDLRESELQDSHHALLQQQDTLTGKLESAQLERDRLDAHWQDLQRQRAGLIGGKSIEANRAELERLEQLIQAALKPQTEGRTAATRGVWRASDVLAQLSDGELVQIRHERDGSPMCVVDRTGQVIPQESLSTAAHDQLYLSLTLALVGSFARRGVQLPLILDEPFLRQNATASSVMAGVLEEFALSGHQVLVFTENVDALRRFESLRANVFDLHALRYAQPEPVEPIADEPAYTDTRVIRVTKDGQQAPVLRLRRQSDEQESAPIYYLSQQSRMGDFPVLGSETGSEFAAIGIRTVGQLLSAEPDDIAQRLDREKINGETVRLWQSHMTLMCEVPHVTLNDAQVLSACGIHSPVELAASDTQELSASIKEFLATERGKRFRSLRSHFNREQLEQWIENAGELEPEPPSAKRATLNADHSSPPQTRPSEIQASEKPTPRRFFLSLQSSVVDAPAIGSATAQHLENVGIRTVADLLNANAQSTAQQLELKHISAETISAWQHQARLVCQIPELQGVGAQLLVACGFTSPRQVADARPEKLAKRIQDFCETPQGQRILRSSEAPPTTRIEKWIENAMRMRPLEAA